MNEIISKNIIIIGGGISGLCTLHYLKNKYKGRAGLSIKLLEKKTGAGGVINSEKDSGALFETGAGSFLNNQPLTLDLISDLGISSQLTEASAATKTRYLCVNQKLYPIPMSPLKLAGFPLFKLKDKWSLIRERMVNPGNSPLETVHEFVSRRLSARWADLLADPMVSGIYAGNSKEIIFKDAFPLLHECEQAHGSVITGLMENRKKTKTKRILFSLKDGMGALVNALVIKNQNDIICSQEVESVSKDNQHQFLVQTSDKIYPADQVFVSAPAYSAGNMLKPIDSQMCAYLNQIKYAPVAVIGFVCAKSDFVKFPAGFGYLKPSSEKSPVLGVLFEDQVFANRSQPDQCLLRLMIGGMHNLHILKYSKEELMDIARTELIQTLGFKGEPFHIFFKAWTNAIPQYDLYRHRAKARIEAALKEHPNLHITANYWDGVSVNDCIKSAHQIVESSKLGTDT